MVVAYSSPVVQHFFTCNNVRMRGLNGDRKIYQPGALRKVRYSNQSMFLYFFFKNLFNASAFQNHLTSRNTLIGISCATIEEQHLHDSSTTIELFYCSDNSIVARVIAAHGAGDFIELLYSQVHSMFCYHNNYLSFIICPVLTACQLETDKSFCLLQGCD